MPGLFHFAFIEWPHFPARVAAQVGGCPGDLVVVVEGGRAVDASAALPEWQAGMAAGRARTLYPFARFLPRARAREHAWHAALERSLATLSPRLEAPGPGQLMVQDPDVDALAAFILAHPGLVGAAAPCTEWARLAACRAHPGTLRLVWDGPAFLAQTPTAVLAGGGGPLGPDGPAVAERLHLFGLEDLGAVAGRLSGHHLRVQFGAALGSRVDGLLRPGRQPTLPVYERPRELQETLELDTPTAASEPWVQAGVITLARRLAEALGGVAAHDLSLEAFAPGRGTARERYLAQRGLWKRSDLVRLTQGLYERLCERLARSLAEVLAWRLTAGGLSEAPTIQADLFTPRTRQPALARAVRLLQRRYGDDVVLRARCCASVFPEERHRFTPFE